MCGICGELRFDGRPADLAALQQMTARLERRGPDHGGSYSDGSLGFGHRRLAVIDLSVHANQPMVDQELGLVLLYSAHKFIYRYINSQIEDLKPGPFQHHTHQIFPDVMHIAFNGSDNNFCQGLNFIANQ